MKNVVHPSNST